MKLLPLGLLSTVAAMLFSSSLLACNLPHCRCGHGGFTRQVTRQITLGQAAPAQTFSVVQAAPAQTFSVVQAAAPTYTLSTGSLQLAAPNMASTQGFFDLNAGSIFTFNRGASISEERFKRLEDAVARIETSTSNTDARLTKIEATTASILAKLPGGQPPAVTDKKEAPLPLLDQIQAQIQSQVVGQATTSPEYKAKLEEKARALLEEIKKLK